MELRRPQPMKPKNPPEAGGGRSRFSLEPRNGAGCCTHPDLRLLAAGTRRECVSVISQQVCSHLLQQPKELLHQGKKNLQILLIQTLTHLPLCQ